jgi:hypothetical protein
MHRWLRVTVMPVRPRGSVAELPWLGLQLPAAMITISNRDGKNPQLTGGAAPIPRRRALQACMSVAAARKVFAQFVLLL